MPDAQDPVRNFILFSSTFTSRLPRDLLMPSTRSTSSSPRHRPSAYRITRHRPSRTRTTGVAEIENQLRLQLPALRSVSRIPSTNQNVRTDGRHDSGHSSLSGFSRGVLKDIDWWRVEIEQGMGIGESDEEVIERGQLQAGERGERCPSPEFTLYPFVGITYVNRRLDQASQIHGHSIHGKDSVDLRLPWLYKPSLEALADEGLPFAFQKPSTFEGMGFFDPGTSAVAPEEGDHPATHQCASDEKGGPCLRAAYDGASDDDHL